jgi:hypothetical protein
MFIFGMVSSSSRSNSIDSTSKSSTRSSRTNSISTVPFPSHFTELMSHPDFASLGDRFLSNIWSERFSFLLDVIRYNPLAFSELREPFIVVFCKELISLYNFDSHRALTYIYKDKVLGDLITNSKAFYLLLNKDLVDDAIRLRSILKESGIASALFSNPTDPYLIAILNYEPQRVSQVFDQIDADSLIALLESGTEDEVLVQVLLGDGKDPRRIDLICTALIKICCTLPDLSKYAHQMIIIFRAIFDERQVTLISAFELRGLVLPQSHIFTYPPELIEAAFIVGRFDVVADLLAENSEIKSKVVEYINRSPAFEAFLIRTPTYFARLITDRNLLACQSRNIFAAFYRYPTFLDILKSERYERVKSLIRFVALQGNLEEISVMFSRLVRLADKWNFFARFVEYNESEDFVDSLKFLLAKCTSFGTDHGLVLAQISTENFEKIVNQAPKLLSQLARAPYGVEITNLH